MEIRLIVGLGNPGPRYQDTRHNAGYRALEHLAGDIGVSLRRGRFSSLTGETQRDGKKLILIKPETYINLSGDAVAAAARYYLVPPEHIIVISDDIALDIGRIRVRARGSAGGHNGLKDIIAKLSSEDFVRIRLGIGEKRPEMDLRDFVLSRFAPEERNVMERVYAEAARAALSVIDLGAEETMSRFNGLDLSDV